MRPRASSVSRWPRTRGVSLCVLALSSAAGTAHAQSAEEQARAAFSAGLEAEKAGKKDEACAQFERSLALVRELGPLVRVARCQAERGQIGAALGSYRELGERLPAGAPERAEAEGQVAALERRQAHLTLEIDGDAPRRIALDGAPLVPPVRDLAIDPGKHELRVEHAAGARTLTVELAEGARRVVRLAPPKEAGGAFPRAVGIGGFVTLGVGALGLAGAITTGVLALDKESAYDACTTGCQPLADEGETLLVANSVLWGVAIAGLGAGGAMILFDGVTADGTQTALLLGPQGIRLGLSF